MVLRMREQIKKMADHMDNNYESKESIDDDVESINEGSGDEGSDESETTLENMSESDSESIVLDPIQEEPSPPPSPPPSPVKNPKRKYTRKALPETLETSDPNIEVQVKTRKKGPRKKVITVYREDVKVDPLIIRGKVRRPRGRPKQKEIEIIKDSDDDDVVIVPKPSPQKELTRKQLKELELHTKLAELQLISGNPSLKLTKRGAVDKRMVKTRTAAQVQATKNLVELNKIKRLRKKEDLKNELLSEQKNVVGNIINSLNQTTITEQKQSENAARIEAEEKLKKSKERQKQLSLFD